MHLVPTSIMGLFFLDSLVSSPGLQASHTSRLNFVYFCMPRTQEELIIGLTLSPSFHTNLVIYLSDSQGKEKALFPKTKHQNPLGGIPHQPQTWHFCCISCKMVRPSPHLLGESLLPKSLHKAAKWNMF